MPPWQLPASYYSYSLFSSLQAMELTKTCIRINPFRLSKPLIISITDVQILDNYRPDS